MGREPVRRRRLQSLARHAHPVDRHLHDGARHLDRQCRARQYRGRARNQRRRKHLGADQLPRGQRDHSADQRLAVGGDRPQALLYDLGRAVLVRFLSVRRRPESLLAHRRARVAGNRRRRHGAERAGDARGLLSPLETGAGLRRLRGRRHRRPGARPDHRRLPHRQCLMALDLFHQHPDRRRLAGARRRLRRRAGHAGQRAAGTLATRSAHRLDGLRPFRPVSGFPRNRARQGTGGRLVQVALHHDLRGGVRPVLSRLRAVGAVALGPNHRHPSDRAAQFRRVLCRHARGRRGAVRHDPAHAAAPPGQFRLHGNLGGAFA